MDGFSSARKIVGAGDGERIAMVEPGFLDELKLNKKITIMPTKIIKVAIALAYERLPLGAKKVNMLFFNLSHGEGAS